MKISTKITCIFILFLIEIVSFIFLYFHFANRYDNYTKSLRIELKKLDLAKNLERALLGLILPGENYYLNKETFLHRSKNIEDLLESLYRLEISEIEERKLLNYITEKYALVKKTSLKIFELPEISPKSGKEQLRTQIENDASNTLAIAEKFHWFIYEKINKIQALQERTRYLLYSIISIGLLLNIFLIGGSLLFLRHSISLPLASLKDYALKIGKGDLNTQIKIKRKDEIGELSIAFNKMVKDLKETQDELIQAEKMASVGQLSAGVAHEIKNPLAIIIQGIEYVKASVSESSLRDALKRITKAALHADRIVKDLLDFSHQTRPLLKEINIISILEEVLSLLKYQVNIEHINIKKEFAPNLSKVKVDSNQIKQVFINLIFNAIDAMPEGGTLTIRLQEIETEERVKHLEITFRDTGYGITPQNLKRVFDPFFTTKKKKSAAGLGLAVSKSIIERHGGTIKLESEVGKGTNVIIRLPIKRKEA